MDINILIVTDKDMLNGLPVFAGNSVPVETLFDHFESGTSLDEFLDDFLRFQKNKLSHGLK